MNRSKERAVAFAQNTRDEAHLVGGDGQTVGALAAQAGMKQTTYVAIPVGIDGDDLGFAVRANPSRSGDKGDGGMNCSVVVHATAIGLTTEQTPKFATDQALTLTKQSPTGGGQPQAVMTPAMAVRRLTPRECERLQGFPDDYTLIPYPQKAGSKKKLDWEYIKYLFRGGRLTQEECQNASADGPRYKAMGNSFAVPCVRWIGERLQMYSEKAVGVS